MKGFLKKILFKAYAVGRSEEAKAAPKQKYPGAVLQGKETLLTVGERVSFGGNVVISLNAPVSIGEDSLIAAGVRIITSTHDYHNNPVWKERIDRPVSIGKNVWIGAGAIILPGIKIGDYAVIGAGSVVTKHVAEKMVVAGNPACYIKERTVAEYDCLAVYPGTQTLQGFVDEQKSILK